MALRKITVINIKATTQGEDGRGGSIGIGGCSDAPSNTTNWRRPEGAVLHRRVQEHAETFFAQVEAETGLGLPDFVKDEFNAFLQCGILAHGFVRVRCADCSP